MIFFDDAELFGTYNKDYKDLTDEDSVQLIVEFDEKYVEQANRAIVNYLSNVGGKIVKINGKQVSKDTLNLVFGAGTRLDGNIGVGAGLMPGQKIETKNQYLISVPKDAQYADELQKKLDDYIIGPSRIK